MTAGPVSKNIQKLFFYEEPDRASFAADHSGTLGDYALIPHAEGSISADPGVNMVDPGQGVQHIFDHREKIPGHKMWTLSFKTVLAPGGTLAADAIAAVPGIAAKLLKNVLGGIEIGTGTTVATNWASPSSGDLTVVASLKPGMALGFVIAGRLYFREIKSIVGSTVTLKVALPGNPQMNDVVYAGVTIYLHRNPTAFAQFLVIGEEDDDRYIFRGGMGTVQIELDLTGEAEPMLTFDFEGRAWTYGEDGATDLSALSFDPEPYVGYAPIASHVGEFVEQVVGTSTLAQTAVKEIAFQLNLDKRPITNPAVEEGLEFYVRVRQNGPSVQGTFTPSFFSDLTRQQRRDDRDAMYLAYAFGADTALGGVLLTASKVQYVSSPPAESDAVGAETVTWEGRNDTNTVEGTVSDLGLSAMRIHIFR